MINKNKETIEKIEKEIEECFKDETNNPETNELYLNLLTELKATIKTSIEWCEDEIEFLKSEFFGYPTLEERFIRIKIRERLENLKSHLKWLLQVSINAE